MSVSRRVWWRRWGPAVVYAALIFIGSSLPFGAPSPTVFNLFTLDKLIHAFEFGLLGILLARAFESEDGRLTFGRVVLAMLMVAAYGALDELHQCITPNRGPDLDDAVADGIGAVVGVLAWVVVSRALPTLRWAHKDSKT